MKKYEKITAAFSITCYASSLIIVYFDSNFTYRWIALALSLIPIILISVVYLRSLSSFKKNLKQLHVHGLIIISLLAIISRLFLLINYPFVSLGDEVREPGYNTQRIVNGRLKNIFGYGQYDAYGLIISTAAVIPFGILGGSVLTYRLPAAIVSILDIILFYFLLSLITKNKIASFMGAMFLISLPLHLYYSRTELVVILSSLFSTIILLSLFIFFKRKTFKTIDFLFLGTVLGFSFNLHGSIKAMSLITIAAIALIYFYQFIKKKLPVSQLIKNLLIFIIFILIGFGPRVLNTSVNIFFNTSRLPFISTEQTAANHSAEKSLGEKYVKSLLVWISEPTTAWYADKKPIFTPITFSLMIVGLSAVVLKKNKFLITVLFIALSLHLTNSALTEMINGDHRLSPLFPIGALFAGFGLSFTFEKIKQKKLHYLIAALLFIFLAFQTISFFTNQPANKNKKTEDYLSMHTIYFLNSNQKTFNKKDEIKFLLSPSNYQAFNTLHYQEQREFFLPNLTVIVESRQNVQNSEIYIKKKDSNFLNQKHIVSCEERSYVCPPNYEGEFVIHY